MTFAFSDIEGSSRLWAARRHQMATAVARHDEIVREIAAAHDGYVFATGGDSFGVAFHRAGDATSWATDLQQAMAREAWPADTDLRVRIGLHTGEAEERANDYFGSAVNVAARIASAGHGGQTLVSRVTAALLDGRDLHDLGTFRFHGVGTDPHILQLGAGDHPPLRTEETRRGNLPRRAGRLFGRDDDLDAVASAMAINPIVTLVGPGGIGKTGLALTAARIAEARPRWRNVVGRAGRHRLIGRGRASRRRRARRDREPGTVVGRVDRRPLGASPGAAGARQL